MQNGNVSPQIKGPLTIRTTVLTTIQHLLKVILQTKTRPIDINQNHTILFVKLSPKTLSQPKIKQSLPSL